jgi:hypothetical protein
MIPLPLRVAELVDMYERAERIIRTYTEQYAIKSVSLIPVGPKVDLFDS